MAGKVTNTYDANSISILEGLEAVRVRPGMYIGSVSTKGLNHLIYKITQKQRFLGGIFRAAEIYPSLQETVVVVGGVEFVENQKKLILPGKSGKKFLAGSLESPV